MILIKVEFRYKDSVILESLYMDREQLKNFWIFLKQLSLYRNYDFERLERLFKNKARRNEDIFVGKEFKSKKEFNAAKKNLNNFI